MLNNAHFLRDYIEITKEKSVENYSWTSCTEKRDDIHEKDGFYLVFCND